MQNCALQSLQLHIEVPLYGLPAERSADSLRPSQSRKKEINWQAIYYHWQRWNAAACFEQIRQQSIHLIQNELDCEQLNLDGFHAIAKKGGESFVYQHRKRAKTSNILPCSDILASTGIVAGNRYDAFNLKANLQTAFKLIKKLRIPIAGAFFNANSALDTRDACKVCFYLYWE